MNDGADDQYKPDLENSLPRAAYDVMQNEKPDPSEIADALEQFGHIAIVREWAIEVLRTKRSRHRPTSYEILNRQIQNGLQALETGSGFLSRDERSTRRDKEVARKYLEFMGHLVDGVREEIEADKKS